MHDGANRAERTAVVLDTNVLIAAGFNPRSNAARIVSAVRRSHLRAIWCPETKHENESLIRKIPPLSWSAFADLFDEGHCYREKLDLSAFSYVPDSSDRVFAALAHAARATLITQDDHLLAARSRADVPFLSPHEFVRFMLRDAGETLPCELLARLTPEQPTEEAAQ